MFQEICIPDEDSPFFMSTTLRLMHELDILASVKDYHLLRLRGQRQRDTSLWNPLFRLQAGFDTVVVAAALYPPRQNGGEAGGYLRQNFSTVSIGAFAGAKIQLVYTVRVSTSLLVSAVFLKIPLQLAYFS